ncbi:nucleotide-binding protein [Microbacterium ulmi]|uniref:Nucleotide-binding protein n=2 Tax=Microbacterium ulmi TaxID=179095 RepID=A0A7Y2LYH3_9MICO|nr:nucleotide-binding protein [Microbacterium ulmi]
MREDVLLLPHCVRCAHVVWAPRPYCPECGSLEVRWEPASGGGAVYSFTVNRRGKGFNRRYEEIGPYVVAYVELDEGPRVLTNIVGCAVDDVRIGQRVRAVIQHSGEDSILRFAPAE